MTYNVASTFTYGGLFAYLHKAYKENKQGGGKRSVSASGRAEYWPQGMDGTGGAEIVVYYHDEPVVSITSDTVELLKVQGLSVPALKLVNRVLADNAPDHTLTLDSKPALAYKGKTLYPGIMAGMYFKDNERFVNIDGGAFYNYKEAN